MVKNPPPSAGEVGDMAPTNMAQRVPQEEEMATRSSILAWEMPQIKEPDVLQSMGLQRVRRD